LSRVGVGDVYWALMVTYLLTCDNVDVDVVMCLICFVQFFWETVKTATDQNSDKRTCKPTAECYRVSCNYGNPWLSGYNCAIPRLKFPSDNVAKNSPKTDRHAPSLYLAMCQHEVIVCMVFPLSAHTGFTRQGQSYIKSMTNIKFLLYSTRSSYIW